MIKVKEPSYPRHPRHDEVKAYLDTNDLREVRWIALDDDPRLYPANCPNLLLCDDGFREAEEELLRKLFQLG